MICKRTKIIVARNYECKKEGQINSVQSSLKSHPLWVTLFVSNKTSSQYQILIPPPPSIWFLLFELTMFLLRSIREEVFQQKQGLHWESEIWLYRQICTRNVRGNLHIKIEKKDRKTFFKDIFKIRLFIDLTFHRLDIS